MMLDLTIEEQKLLQEIIIENINYWQDARSDTMEEMIRGKKLDIAYKDYLDHTSKLKMLESIFMKILDI